MAQDSIAHEGKGHKVEWEIPVAQLPGFTKQLIEKGVPFEETLNLNTQKAYISLNPTGAEPPTKFSINGNEMTMNMPAEQMQQTETALKNKQERNPGDFTFTEAANPTAGRAEFTITFKEPLAMLVTGPHEITAVPESHMPKLNPAVQAELNEALQEPRRMMEPSAEAAWRTAPKSDPIAAHAEAGDWRTAPKTGPVEQTGFLANVAALFESLLSGSPHTPETGHATPGTPAASATTAGAIAVENFRTDGNIDVAKLEAGLALLKKDFPEDLKPLKSEIAQMLENPEVRKAYEQSSQPGKDDMALREGLAEKYHIDRSDLLVTADINNSPLTDKEKSAVFASAANMEKHNADYRNKVSEELHKMGKLQSEEMLDNVKNYMQTKFEGTNDYTPIDHKNDMKRPDIETPKPGLEGAPPPVFKGGKVSGLA